MQTSYTFSQLQKFSKKDMSALPVYRLALTGDCATQHLNTALRGYAFTCGLNLDIFEADYDQITAQITDKGSEMYAFRPDAVLIFMCSEKLYDRWCGTTAEERGGFADAVFGQISSYWEQLGTNSAAKILQFTFTENDDFVSGNFACKHPQSYIYQLRRLNMLLMQGAAGMGNVFPVDLCGLSSRFGRDTFFSSTLYYIAKMSIVPDALPPVAASVVAVIQALRGCLCKCIITDLDNTLWGGVIGDDGLSGIEIGELGTGPAFTALQTWLQQLRQRGVLLAVCSKNEEATAKEPFEKHPEMVLRLDDFAVFIANWDDKAANIRKIRQTLNIGFDSIVFVDDNPFEREAVRSLVPDIIVPELPDDPAGYLPFLQGLNLFETASLSSEDTDRTGQYRAQAEREALVQQFDSYDDYLKSLDMVASALPFDEMHTPRIAQLTQRSNQFNLRTVRYTDGEIEAAAQDPGKLTLYFTLKDKISDYGLVGVVIMNKLDGGCIAGDSDGGKALFIDTWLMSCRVLKRGMEEFIINKIIETAAQNGFDTVIGEYIETAKNAMVADIYEKLGFVRCGHRESCAVDLSGQHSGDLFVAKVNEFRRNETHIQSGQNASDNQK